LIINAGTDYMSDITYQDHWDRYLDKSFDDAITPLLKNGLSCQHFMDPSARLLISGNPDQQISGGDFSRQALGSNES
jgi:hypothetical protein